MRVYELLFLYHVVPKTGAADGKQWIIQHPTAIRRCLIRLFVYVLVLMVEEAAPLCSFVSGYLNPQHSERGRQRGRDRVRRKTNGRSEQKGQKTNGVEGETQPVVERERERWG